MENEVFDFDRNNDKLQPGDFVRCQPEGHPEIVGRIYGLITERSYANATVEWAEKGEVKRGTITMVNSDLIVRV